KSVATTSRLTSPGTVATISSTSGRNGFFSLAASDGFVVTPSTRPSARPSLISLMFAVSRKIFIAPPWPSGPFQLDRRARLHVFENRRVADHAPDDVHATRRPTFVALARGRPAEEDAERLARRPVRQRAEVDHLARLLRRRGQTDVEVDLVAPRVRARRDRQRVPDRGGGLRLVEPALRGHGIYGN